jgi:hypothetical protein
MNAEGLGRMTRLVPLAAERPESGACGIKDGLLHPTSHGLRRA